MKLKPLQEFICDSCGKKIKHPKDGWVEWLCPYSEEIDDFMSSHFRIVHHASASRRLGIDCNKYTDHTHRADLHLTQFIDAYFLTGLCVSSMKEFTDLMKRLTIPYFEEARFYFDDAIDDPDFDTSLYPEGGNEAGFKAIVERYHMRHKL